MSSKICWRSQNRADPYREACDLSRLIQDVTESYCALFADKGVRLELEVSPISPQPRLDEQGVHRCLLNLVGNASDAVPESSGRVQVRAFGTPEGHVQIEVSDNGPGIAENLREKVFEPFFSTKGSSGTGLGLAVTRKIVNEHGGRIHVEQSTLGGAKFVLQLPGG